MAKNTKTIGVVGGGIQGLALAYFLSKNSNYKVVLFEKNKNLGGLLGLLNIAGTAIEGFYHHWFTSHNDIINLAKELRLADNLFYKKGKIGVFHQNCIYPFTTVFDLLKFYPLSLADRLRLGFSVFLLKIMKNPSKLENITAVEWLKTRCGLKAYELVWEPLLRGKFGDHKDSISMAWMWGRIHERGNSPFLVYPRGGFKNLIDKMSESIIKSGGEVKTNFDINYIDQETNGISIFSPEEKAVFDNVFFTAPVNVFIKLVRGLPDEYKRQLEKIKYRAAHVVVLVLKKSLMPQGYYWVNVQDRNIPLLAVIEHTNLVPKEDYGGRTIVYLGNYPDPNDPIMSLKNEEVVDLYAGFLPKINKDFNKNWIEEYYVFKDPNGQPIVDLGYKDRLPAYQTPLAGLSLVSMAQIYPSDRGTDNAVKQAKEVIRIFGF